MSEALVVASETHLTDPVPTSVHLVARNPVEMQNAQADLGVWLKNRLNESKMEVGELGASLSEARSNGWSLTALTRQRNKAIGRFQWYNKILAAVEAGYTIIPEFPIEVFAIRITRSNVRAGDATSSWKWPTPDDERPDVANVGEGEYKNPSQLVKHFSWEDTQKDGTKLTRHTTRPVGFQDEVVFPLRAARPAVMSATAEAMALRVFDQIGICEPRSNAGGGIQRKGDPLIIGQVLGKREGWAQKCASFIIAWHLDLRTL